jgi:hypothetical protein
MDYYEDEKLFYEKALQEIENVKAQRAYYLPFQVKMLFISLPFRGLTLQVSHTQEVFRTLTVVLKFHLAK